MGKTVGKIITKTGVNPPSVPVLMSVPQVRARGQKPMVAMSFRISRQVWERLHLLAITEGVSINTLTLRGLSRLFEERGLPGLVIGVQGAAERQTG